MPPRYKLLTYIAASGEPRAGLALGDIVTDAETLSGKPGYRTLLGILEDWPAAQDLFAQINPAQVSGLPLAAVKLAAPVLYPGTIYCAGANYRDHVAEMAEKLGLPREPDPHEAGLKPWHFIKPSRGAVVAPGSDLTLPAYSTKVDWEAELVAVIGRTARNVRVEDALDHVAGYTIANDLSARDHLKRDAVNDLSPFKYDWISQKCFDGSCPLGPWITPAEAIADPQNLGIKLWINDELKQNSSSSQMIFSIGEQIAQLSTRMTLNPGDLILTGTPAGVGTASGRFLKPGDQIRIWIEGIGELKNNVVA